MLNSATCTGMLNLETVALGYNDLTLRKTLRQHYFFGHEPSQLEKHINECPSKQHLYTAVFLSWMQPPQWLMLFYNCCIAEFIPWRAGLKKHELTTSWRFGWTLRGNSAEGGKKFGKNEKCRTEHWTGLWSQGSKREPKGTERSIAVCVEVEQWWSKWGVTCEMSHSKGLSVWDALEMQSDRTPRPLFPPPN